MDAGEVTPPMDVGEITPRITEQRKVTPIRRLYVSHMLAQFGDRLWQFAVPILFISVWTDTLLPSAIFQFALSVLRIVFVPAVGRRVDTTDRLKLVRFGTFGQNTCIFVSGALLALLFWRVDKNGTWMVFGEDPGDTLLFVLLILIGIVGDLFSIAGKLGVEKDWVVVIVDEELRRGDTQVREERLTQLNSTLRRIDLICKIVAPLSFGLLIGIPGQTRRDEVMLGTGMVCAWSVLSTFPIYWAWRSVYFEYADLQSKKPPKKQNPFTVLVQGGKAYVRHPVFAPSIGFCMLFFTVLSDHHPLTTAFLKMDGVSNAVLGASRGCGAFTGIVGTFIFPKLCSRLGLVPANIVEAWAFVGCILPISLLYIGDTGTVHAYALLTAIVLSRVFLWGFDLANVQLMQEMVEESARGELNGMQSATCNVMEFVMAILGLFCTSRNNFRVLVFASGGGVTCAALVITLWAVRRCRAPEGPDAQLTPTLISD